MLAYSYSRLIEKQNVVSADMERAHFKQKAFLHIQFKSIWQNTHGKSRETSEKVCDTQLGTCAN